MTTPVNARTTLRELVVICKSGLIGGTAGAAVVLPFAALGIAWGTVIVLTVLVPLFVGLLVRNYHQILLFAVRRSIGDASARDGDALGELFDAFAAERRATRAGRAERGGVIDLCLFRLATWFVGARRLGVHDGSVRPASR